MINMKLTAAAVTLATLAGASARSGTSKSGKSSPSEDKFDGAWRGCIERSMVQIGPNDESNLDFWYNKLLQITKVPGELKYSAVYKSTLQCDVFLPAGAGCFDQPETGFTELFIRFVAVQSLSLKSKDTLNFLGNYASYLDANGNEVSFDQGAGNFEIGLITCSAEEDGALVCDFMDSNVLAEGPLANLHTATTSSVLLIKDDGDFESKCAELSLAR